MIRLIYIFGMCILIRGIKTIQNISMNSGQKKLAAVLTGLDTLFFFLVFKNVIDNEVTFMILSTVVSGYIVGFFLGTYIEEKIGLGKVMISIKIPSRQSNRLSKLLDDHGFVFTTTENVLGKNKKRKKIHQGVVFRKELDKLEALIGDLDIIATVKPVKSTFGRALMPSNSGVQP
jgi:uncharacterized protein YebE (UPF0316 family)